MDWWPWHNIKQTLETGPKPTTANQIWNRSKKEHKQKNSSSESKVKVGQEPMKRWRKPPSRLKRGIERFNKRYLDKVKKTENKSDHNCFTALKWSKPCGNKRPKSKAITALHKSTSSESKVKVGQEPMKRWRKPPSNLKRGIEKFKKRYLDKVKKTEKKSDHNCFTALKWSKPCGNKRPKSKAITALHKSTSSESKVKVGQEPMKWRRKPPSRLKGGIERFNKCYLDKVKKTEKKSDHNCFKGFGAKQTLWQ